MERREDTCVIWDVSTVWGGCLGQGGALGDEQQTHPSSCSHPHASLQPITFCNPILPTSSPMLSKSIDYKIPGDKKKCLHHFLNPNEVIQHDCTV